MRLNAVRALLRAHLPADAREAGFVSEMLALTDTDGDPLSRAHFVPGHFTASAFVLSPDERELLLVLHGKLGRWLQPGGHIEPDDLDPIAAALREVAEEVGVAAAELPDGQVLLDVDIHEIPPLKGDPPHRHYDLRILLRATGRDFVAGSDARDARWVPLDRVDPQASDESVMRAVRKLMARAPQG